MARITRPLIDGGREPAPKPAPKPAATPAATPTNTPAPRQIGGSADAAYDSRVLAQSKLLTELIAKTIVNTPVVTNTAKGEAPNKVEVESITKAIVDSLAPSLTPNLSSAVIDSIVSNTTNAIVTNPDVKASGVGQSVTPAVVNQITQTAAGEGGTFGAVTLERQREKDLQESLGAAKEAKTTTPMSKEEWDKRQEKLASADRTPYEQYVKDFVPKAITGSTDTGSTGSTGSTGAIGSNGPLGGLPAGVVAGVDTKPNTETFTTIIPTNLSSPKAKELFNTIKGKATASGYRPTEEEQKFMESYQVNRLELIKGKKTSGNPLTEEEKAEEKFLLERGYGEKLSGLKPPVDSLTQYGPLGGLSSGAVASVLAPTGYDANGNPTGIQGNEATGANYLAAGGGTKLVLDTNINPISGAPQSGIVKNFTPTFNYPEWDSQPGDPDFVGPVPINTNTNTSTNNNNTNNSNNITNSNNTTTIYNNGNDPNVVTLVSTQLDEYGNTIGFYSDGSSKTLLQSGRKFRTTVDEDAYAILTKTLTDAGLAELASVIQSYMEKDIGPNQAALEIRKEPAYFKRFKGNEDRRSAGLNVLSEAEYLDLENSYMQTLKAYGYANELGADTSTRQAAMANLIAGDTSAVEFKERIDTIVTRVKNADPKVKETMTSFFGIKDEDLVKYFINPKENLPKLQEKVTAAEIGAAAITQNLATSSAAATALAQYGITKEQAREGYSSVGEVLPTSSKLGEIYGDTYTQATAEQEVFQGLASAKRKRQQLAEREVASFSGSSGRLRTGTQQSNTGQF